MSKTGLRAWAIAAIVVLAAATAPRAQEGDAEDLYYQGWHAETGERDLEKALSLYRGVLEKFADAETTAAKAQYQIAGCLEKLGRAAEAATAYRAVVDRFAAQRELAAKAEERLRALGVPAPKGDAATAPPASDDPVLAGLAEADPRARGEAYAKLRALDPARQKAMSEALGAIADEKARARARVALEALVQGITDADGLRLWTQLHLQRVDLDFTDTPLSEVMAFLRDFSGLNVVLDDSRVAFENGPRITMRVRDLPLHDSLQLMCRMHQLVPMVHEGALVITTADGQGKLRRLAEARAARAAGQPAATEGVAATLARLKVSINFEAAPLDDVLSFLRDLAQINILLQSSAGEAIGARPVSLQLRDLTLGRALALVCDLQGLEYAVEQGVVVIRARG